jgi:hypothetical protein
VENTKRRNPETHITLRRVRGRLSAILTYHSAMRANVKKIAIFVLAAITLTQPALLVAGGQSTDSRPKPSSFVPHSQTNQHVYGAPIGTAIVGHSKVSHHKHTPKKALSSPKK